MLLKYFLPKGTKKKKITPLSHKTQKEFNKFNFISISNPIWQENVLENITKWIISQLFFIDRKHNSLLENATQI